MKTWVAVFPLALLSQTFNAMGSFQALSQDLSSHSVLLTISSYVVKAFYFLNFTKTSTNSHDNSLTTPLLFSLLGSLCGLVKIYYFSLPPLFPINRFFQGELISSHLCNNSRCAYGSSIWNCPPASVSWVAGLNLFLNSPVFIILQLRDDRHLSIHSAMSYLQIFSSVFLILSPRPPTAVSLSR